LSPYLFLLVVESLSREIHDARRHTFTRDTSFQRITLSHILFVDDVLLFGLGSVRENQTLKEILDLYLTATRMEINLGKSYLYTFG
jgi:hypothetical protein